MALLVYWWIHLLIATSRLFGSALPNKAKVAVQMFELPNCNFNLWIINMPEFECAFYTYYTYFYRILVVALLCILVSRVAWLCCSLCSVLWSLSFGSACLIGTVWTNCVDHCRFITKRLVVLFWSRLQEVWPESCVAMWYPCTDPQQRRSMKLRLQDAWKILEASMTRRLSNWLQIYIYIIYIYTCNYIIYCDALWCFVMLCDALWCFVMLCDALWCFGV